MHSRCMSAKGSAGRVCAGTVAARPPIGRDVMFRSNFESPAWIRGDEVFVVGTSEPQPGMRCVSRHVALIRNAGSVHIDADLREPEWEARFSIQATGLTPGRILAIGTETYFDEGATPAFITVSWSEVILLQLPRPPD